VTPDQIWKFSLWFTSKHRANCKENVAIHQKSLRVLFQALLQMYMRNQFNSKSTQVKIQFTGFLDLRSCLSKDVISYLSVSISSIAPNFVPNKSMQTTWLSRVNFMHDFEKCSHTRSLILIWEFWCERRNFIYLKNILVKHSVVYKFRPWTSKLQKPHLSPPSEARKFLTKGQTQSGVFNKI